MLQRLQALSMWFIDGASLVDVDEPRFHLYTLYERRGGQHQAAGYMTTFRAVAQQAKQAHVAKATDTVDFKLNPESREESDSEEEGGGVEAGMDLLPQVPAAKAKKQQPESGKKKKKRSVEEEDLEGQEDVVEDLVLSSDEEDGVGALAEPVSYPNEEGEDEEEEERPPHQSSGRKSKKKARRQ